MELLGLLTRHIFYQYHFIRPLCVTQRRILGAPEPLFELFGFRDIVDGVLIAVCPVIEHHLVVVVDLLYRVDPLLDTHPELPSYGGQHGCLPSTRRPSQH